MTKWNVISDIHIVHSFIPSLLIPLQVFLLFLKIFISFTHEIIKKVKVKVQPVTQRCILIFIRLRF